MKLPSFLSKTLSPCLLAYCLTSAPLPPLAPFTLPTVSPLVFMMRLRWSLAGWAEANFLWGYIK